MLIEQAWLQPHRSRLAWIVAIAVVGMLGACGRVPVNSGETTPASAARTASPSLAPSPTTTQPLPDSRLLTASNCSAAAAASQPRLLGRYYTIRPTPNWADTGDYQHTETLLLELTAPNVYGFAPSRVDFVSDLGPVHTVYGAGATAHSIAQQHAASIAQETSPHAVAGTISDCSVGGEAAAAYGYSDETDSGFYVYVVHNDALFKVILFGAGGVSNQAIQDSLAMLGSLSWTF